MTEENSNTSVLNAGGEEIHMESTDDERLMALLIYVTSIFTYFVGPLIIWLIKREDSKFVDAHGKEYFNFIISYTVYSVVLVVGAFVLNFIFLLIPVIGIIVAGIIDLVVALFFVAMLVFLVIAAVKSYKGELYKIPLVIRLIK